MVLQGVQLTASHEAPRRVVLKLPLPHAHSTARAELQVLLTAQGCGYARVLRRQLEPLAWLMEELGAPLADDHLEPLAQMRALCEALRLAWRPVERSDQPHWASGADKAAELALFIRQGRDLIAAWTSASVIEQALSSCETRRQAFDPQRAILAHGDPHTHNLLRSPEATSGYKLIDPDGLFIEPEYDLGVVMREWNLDDLGGQHAARRVRTWCGELAGWTGTRAEVIEQWALIERVSTSIALAQLGLPEQARALLDVAAIWNAYAPTP